MIRLLALLDKQKSKSQINTDIKDLEKLVRKLRLTATLAKGTTKTELNQTIKQLETQLRQIKLQARIDNRQLNREINNALRNVSARDINLNINSNGERLTTQVRRAVAQAREFVERNPISVNIDLKREKLLNQLTAFTNKHTKINESSYWLGEAERLRTVISSVTNSDELRDATDQFQVFTTGVRATGYAAVSTTDRIKGMLGNIIKVGNYFGLAFVAVNKFRQSLSTLKENDTILTEISKTSELTKQQLKELGDEAFRIASKYGQSSGNYLLAVQEMARSGYEMMSKELAELSLLAQSAGDMTADSANNYLLATDAAYKYGGSVEKLNAALDGANYISNKNSANLTDIADATRVSASFAANASVAIDELTAAEATMIAVTKRSGSEIGRAFRSIVLNLQQVSGEFDGEVISEEDLAKVEARCHSLGVELEYMKDGVPTLRNTMDVLRDLAEVYNSLPDNSAEKQGLIADIGGKYHANALSALLSRWDMYEKMLGEFSQGAGSALEEANKTADSWEGRLAQLQNSWDSFVNSITNKSAVKGGVSFLDNTIQAFEKLTDSVGALPVLLATINASMSALNKNFGITQIYNKDTHKIDLQGNFMGIDITGYKTQLKHFREAEIAMESWNNSLVDGTANINTFNNATVQNSEQLRAYLQTTSVDAPASLDGYRAYLNAAGESTDALRLKTVLMTSAMSIGFAFALQAVIQVVQAAATAIDNWIHRVEKANEAMNEAISEYDSAKSSLESVNTKLEEQNKKIDELLAKGKLTYAEKGQLEELQEITKELLLQQDIEQRRAKKAAEDVADKTVDAYNKQYGRYDISKEDLNEKSENAKISGMFPIVDGENDITGNIAAYIRASELLTEARQNYEKALENGEDTEYLSEDIQNCIDAVNEYSNTLDENISDLQQKRLALEDAYNKAVEKRNNGTDLTSLDKDVIETYESIYDAMKLIYEYKDQNTWNNMEISSIFNTEGIEKTKEELISMYKAGELSSVEMLEQFPKLYKAIKESEIITGEGSNAFKEFYNEIAALAEEASDSVADTNESISTSLSITDTIKQLNTQLKPTFDSLKSAYQDIFTTDDNGKPLFTLENVDLSMLDSIKSAIDELNENEELGIHIDYSEFENLAMVLADTSSESWQVQEAFNSFATDILNATTATDGMTQETAQLVEQMLESLGVTNANEIALNALREAKAQSILTTYDLADATNEEFAAILAEGEAAGLTEQQIYSLTAAEIAFGNNDLSVEGKIGKLRDLASAYGDTASAALATAIANDLASGHTDVDAAINDIMAKINTGVKKAEVNFFPKAKSNSKKSGGSSKKEEDKWLAEYKKKLAELQNMLDMELINEKEFYNQSDALLNSYLKDTPEHIEKYAEEISNAEKTLHGNWVSSFEYEMSQLKEDLDRGYIVQWQYYQKLNELKNQYFAKDYDVNNLAFKTDIEVPKELEELVDYYNALCKQADDAGDSSEEMQKQINHAFDSIDIQAKNLGGSMDDYIEGTYQSYGSFGEEFDKYSAEIAEGQRKLWKDVFGNINNEIDGIQSAVEAVSDAVKDYNEDGKLNIDTVQELLELKPQYIELLFDENGQITLNEEAYRKLAYAKLEEMKVDLANQAIQTIYGLESETLAVEYLTNAEAELRDTTLSATEALLQQAVAWAHAQSDKQGEAADSIYKSYQNQIKVINLADFSMPSLAPATVEKNKKEDEEKKEKEEKEEKENQKQFDWIATLLDRISSKVSKLTDKIEKFYNWQKKNLMITRTVKANNEQITHEQNAYQMYMRKAKSVGLPSSYVKKIQDGTLNIETIKYYDEDEKAKLVEQIEAYEEWYDKAQDCLDTINDLYDT